MRIAGPVLAAFILGLAVAASGGEPVYGVTRFGAVGDGKALCTQAVQKAIDECAAAGGGTVRIPAGTFLTGTLYMKSRVTLHLEAGAVLLGSPDMNDYPEIRTGIRSYTDNYVNRRLISGENLESIAIRGRGTIDGHGDAFRRKEYLTRPYVIRFVGCRDVLVEGVRMRSSPMWMQHYLACDRVAIRDVTVFNHSTYNNDGLDIDGCRDVTVSGCRIDSDDDALCLKSTLDRPCENVTISNCILSSHCNALKMGTESNGGFLNVTVTNCVITSPPESQAMYGQGRGLAGIALEIVDGGRLDGVAISNCVIRGVTAPIFMRLGNRARPFAKDGPKPGVGTFRNVSLSHIIARDASRTGCAIAGIPGHPIENVSLSDIQLAFEGGGTREEASRQVPEEIEKYPESQMFGGLPAYGLYVRHVRGLKASNVHLACAKTDLRHSVVCDDAADITFDSLDVAGCPGAAAIVRLTNAAGVFIRGCRPQAPEGTFLLIDGPATGRITLLANDLTGARRPVEIAADVPKDAFVQRANVPAELPE
jgi:polygalacturonase